GLPQPVRVLVRVRGGPAPLVAGLRLHPRPGARLGRRPARAEGVPGVRAALGPLAGRLHRRRGGPGDLGVGDGTLPVTRGTERTTGDTGDTGVQTGNGARLVSC